MKNLPNFFCQSIWQCATTKTATKSITLAMSIAILLLGGCQKHNDTTFQGYVEGKYTYVSSAVPGTLTNLLVDKGDNVAKGQLLFKLDPNPESAQLQIAQQNLAHAKQLLEDAQKGGRETVVSAIEAQQAQASANNDLAEKNFHRYQILYKTRTIDKATLDNATDTYKATSEKLKEVTANLAEAKLGARENIIAAQKAQVDSETAAVNQAEWALQQKTIAAPSDAMVFDTLHEQGEFVPAGGPVVVLLPRDTFKVIFFIPQNLLSQIVLGKKIQFTCDQCHALYDANISFISPDPEYTPPVIFSKETRDKLVYRIEAKISPPAVNKINAGQPVDVIYPLK